MINIESRVNMKSVEKYILIIIVMIAIGAVGAAVYFGFGVDKSESIINNNSQNNVIESDQDGNDNDKINIIGSYLYTEKIELHENDYWDKVVELSLEENKNFWYVECVDVCYAVSGTYEINNDKLLLNGNIYYGSDLSCSEVNDSFIYKIEGNTLKADVTLNKVNDSLENVNSYKNSFLNVACAKEVTQKDDVVEDYNPIAFCKNHKKEIYNMLVENRNNSFAGKYNSEYLKDLYSITKESDLDCNNAVENDGYFFLNFDNTGLVGSGIEYNKDLSYFKEYKEDLDDSNEINEYFASFLAIDIISRPVLDELAADYGYMWYLEVIDINKEVVTVEVTSDRQNVLAEFKVNLETKTYAKIN